MVSRITTEEEAKLFLLMYVKRSCPVAVGAWSEMTTAFILGMEFAFAVPEYARALMQFIPDVGAEEQANVARRAAGLFPVEVA